jgi:hypothetical protein
MLPKLKQAGHRILMFSQMTKVMDLLESYCSMRGFWSLRLDGQTSPEDREQRMFRFNAYDSPYFIFLLSTRAGGLGLNLATADTVILFDRDWNPMMDAQAQDRAHRIGQKNEVRVFTLLTNSPIEEKILARAQEKFHMAKMVVEAGGFNNKTKESDRKQMIQDLMGMGGIKEDDDDEVGDDAHLNEMMAVTEHEFNLYQQMDHDKKEQAMLDVMAERGEGDHDHRCLLKPEALCITTNDWDEVCTTFIHRADVAPANPKDADDDADDDAEGEEKDKNEALFPLVIKAVEKAGKSKEKKKARIRLVFTEEDAKAAFHAVVRASSQRAVVFHYSCPPGLMGREEVPDWVKKSEEEIQMDPAEQARIELEDYGHGKRKRKEVTYNDGLTERQFMRIVDKEQDIGEAIQNKKDRGKRKSLKKDSLGGGVVLPTPKDEGGDEGVPQMDEGEAEAVVEPKEKRRKISTSSSSEKGKGKAAKVRSRVKEEAPKEEAPPKKEEAVAPASSGEEDSDAAPEQEKVDVFGEWKSALNMHLKIVHLQVQENCTYEGSDVKRCVSFMTLPSKEHYPDYFRTIKKPVSMAEMVGKMDKQAYKAIKDYKVGIAITPSTSYKLIDPGPFLPFFLQAFEPSVKPLSLHAFPPRCPCTPSFLPTFCPFCKSSFLPSFLPFFKPLCLSSLLLLPSYLPTYLCRRTSSGWCRIAKSTTRKIPPSSKMPSSCRFKLGHV